MRTQSNIKIERRIVNKLMLIKHLGGKCVECGFIGHHAVFEFDHVDPATKLGNISRLLHYKDTTRILAEAEHCQLLCGNCHNIKSWEEGSIRKGRSRVKEVA